MFEVSPWMLYVPTALALHAFVAWHVWHARREANDAMDYVTGSGDYAESGGLAGDLMVLVNERIAGGAVGALGELVSPFVRHAAEKLETSLRTPPQRAGKEGPSPADSTVPAKGKEN